MNDYDLITNMYGSPDCQNEYNLSTTPNVLDNYINNNSVVLDIGAHVGTFSYRACHVAKRIYAFEPNIENYLIFCRNIALNNFRNIIPLTFALGDKMQITHYNWYCPRNTGASGLDISDSVDTPDVTMFKNRFGSDVVPKYDVFVTTIDNLDLDQLDFIKIDTEGCEYKILCGGINTIKKYKPVIFLESYDIDNKINQFLVDLGYVFITTPRDKLYVPKMSTLHDNI
jgi:FkbM family methyltransferase